MHKTTAAVAVLAIASLAALVVVLAALSPLASRALADPAPASFSAVCVTDSECAVWDAEHYAMPVLDAAGEPTCTAGTDLYDTENPDLGSTGVVCRPLMEA